MASKCFKFLVTSKNVVDPYIYLFESYFSLKNHGFFVVLGDPGIMTLHYLILWCHIYARNTVTCFSSKPILDFYFSEEIKQNHLSKYDGIHIYKHIFIFITLNKGVFLLRSRFCKIFISFRITYIFGGSKITRI